MQCNQCCFYAPLKTTEVGACDAPVPDSVIDDTKRLWVSPTAEHQCPAFIQRVNVPK